MQLKFILACFCLLGIQNLSEATDLIRTVPTNPTSQEHIYPKPPTPLSFDQQKQVLKNDLMNSSKSAEEWFNLVDAGKYKESWGTMALTTKVLMKNKEWETYLQASRKPFGKNIRRTLIDQRVANNPPGVPKGEYMVIYYDSSFANKSNAKELIILQQANNGSWHVFSYVVK